MFESEKDYRENHYLQIKQDLHIPEGISSIPGYIRISEKNQFQAFSQNLKKTLGQHQTSSDKHLNMEIINDPEILKAADLPEKQYKVSRTFTLFNRIIRDTEISRRVKTLHNYRCQICGYTIDLGSGKYYAEAHHIKPLGSKHNGPDIVENIICVCPNHHVLLDYGAIPINQINLRTLSGYIFSEAFIEYHNTTIYKHITGSIIATK